MKSFLSTDFTRVACNSVLQLTGVILDVEAVNLTSHKF